MYIYNIHIKSLKLTYSIISFHFDYLSLPFHYTLVPLRFPPQYF